MKALKAEHIRSELAAERAETINVTVLETVDSTNAEALRHVNEARSGSIWLAEQQTAGRGRRGKQWISPKASNLYFSMLWKIAGEQSQLGGLSLAVGVTLGRVLRAAGLSNVQLKWPNDVLIAHQKLAGILLEMQLNKLGEVCMVIGIGLNVQMAKAAKQGINQPWVDMASLLPVVPDRNSLAAALASELIASLESFENHGFLPFASEWHAQDALAGCAVKVLTGEHVRYGKALGVAEDGALKLQTEEGVELIFGGEVSVRLAGGEE